MKKLLRSFFCLLLCGALILCVGCRSDGNKSQTAGTANTLLLNGNIAFGGDTGTSVSESVSAAQIEFTRLLLEKLYSGNSNTVISPFSLTLALAMLANGADGETLGHLLTLLGNDVSEQALNDQLAHIIATLPNVKDRLDVSVSNSAWVNKKITVSDAFLQNISQYYDAQIYSTSFDPDTADQINNWVKDKTDGQIDKLVGENDFNPTTIIMLLNALTFKAEWKETYRSSSVDSGVFTREDGTEQTVNMMSSNETLYLSKDGITGFMKPYCGTRYVFATLLPEKGTTVAEMLSSLGDGGLQQILDSPARRDVIAKMPRFKAESEYDLQEALSALGLSDLFGDKANLSRLNANEPLFVSKVKQKAAVSVDENGTVGTAATTVAVDTLGVDDSFVPVRVTLDRPFVYIVYDRTEGLPLFAGVASDITE